MKKLILLLAAVSSISVASIQDDLDKAFKSMNFNSNVNGAYAAQSAGHYSGGSLYARSQIRNQQIAYINLPKISAGCGGIDIFTGGFSIVSKDEAITLAKNIMSNAKGFAFNLALETASPLISNNMKDLVKKVAQMTNQSINSCETAAGLVGSVFPKTEESQRSVCQSISGSSGYLNDYVSARMECSKPSARKGAFEKAKKEPGHEKQLLGSMNFSWNAIKSNDLFKGDNEISELMMSLSGTVIYQDSSKSGGAKKQYFPSLATNNDFISALMFGGQLDIYGCDDDDKCLNPVMSKKNIPVAKSIVYLVKSKLDSIVRKIRAITIPLDDSEKKFIQSTSLPIYKMLNVQSAYSKGISAFDVSNYSEIIASDILYMYLEESIQEVLHSARTLQLPEAEFIQFIDHIEGAKRNIRDRKQDVSKKHELVISMINQTQQLEQRLSARLQGNLKDAMTWSDNI